MTKFLPKGKLWLMGILLLIAVTAPPALADPITIANPSFEADILGNGAWNYSVTDWALAGSGGTWNPGIGIYPGGAPDAANVAWTHNSFIYQILSDTIQPNYQYTLEAYVGKFSTNTVHYFLKLIAAESDVVLASVTGDAAYQTFNLVSLSYTVTDQYLGEHLVVAFGNTESTEVDFDNVTLTGTDPVPLPSTLILLSSSLLGLIGWRRMSQI